MAGPFFLSVRKLTPRCYLPSTLHITLLCVARYVDRVVAYVDPGSALRYFA